MAARTSGGHIGLPLLLRYLLSAIETELCTHRQFRLAIAALQFGLHVEPAGGAEVVVYSQVSAALRALPNRHHLMSAVRAKTAIDSNLSMAPGAIHLSFLYDALNRTVMIDDVVKHAGNHHPHACTYADTHSGSGSARRSS